MLTKLRRQPALPNKSLNDVERLETTRRARMRGGKAAEAGGGVFLKVNPNRCRKELGLHGMLAGFATRERQAELGQTCALPAASVENMKPKVPAQHPLFDRMSYLTLWQVCPSLTRPKHLGVGRYVAGSVDMRRFARRRQSCLLPQRRKQSCSFFSDV